MDGHLGIVGADLETQVAVTPLRLEGVADERWETLQLGWSSGCESVSVDPVLLEHTGPEPDRDGQATGRQVEGFTRIFGRRLRIAADGPGCTGLESLGHPRRRV